MSGSGRRWALLLGLAVLLTGCAGNREAQPDENEDREERPEVTEPLDMEALLVPNGRERFQWDQMTVNGLPVSDSLGLWPGYFLDLLGPAAEEFAIPAYEGAELERVYRFSDGSEMRCWTDPAERVTPLGVSLLCLAGEGQSLCGVQVGDHWLEALEQFAVEEPVRTVNGWGEEIWLLYGEAAHMGEQGFVAMENGRPSYLFYGDEASVWFALDEAGYVAEAWYNQDGGRGGRYEPPETLYPYGDIAGAGASACRGCLLGDVLQPLSADYIALEGTEITVSYQLPAMRPGERFTVDRTAEIRDAAALFLSCPEAETVAFQYVYPAYDYGFSELAITREEAELAVGTALSVPAGGDWTAFDRQLRSAVWAGADAMDTVEMDHLLESAGDPLADNSRPAFAGPELDGVPMAELDEEGCRWFFGQAEAVEDIPVYDGAETYRVFTYPGGVMAGGWLGDDGMAGSLGALYISGERDLAVNGIRLGDRADWVLRSFRVEGAWESALPDYEAEDAVILYGEPIHMGTYGFAVREDGRWTEIRYGALGTVVTFLLDGEERVCAIQIQEEGSLRLPLED